MASSDIVPETAPAGPLRATCVNLPAATLTATGVRGEMRVPDVSLGEVVILAIDACCGLPASIWRCPRSGAAKTMGP
ncbi:unannotated protein [freshwater metagenome]|uniref:Unannotated protein n=1 Tax=freshwater metagenome TaxID=449393 RepID=A0A6J7L6G7_9ZZZZ